MSTRRSLIVPPNVAMVVLGLCGVLIGACDSADLRPGATSILTMFAEPTPEEAVAMATDPHDADKRYRGTLLLGTQPYAGEAVYMKLFDDNAKDKDPGVRTAAMRAIANHGSEEQVPTLLKALGDPDKLVRIEAARGLQRIHSNSAVDPLIKSLNPTAEPVPEVRAEAADALGQYREPRVVEALIRVLEDTNLAVNAKTLRSLQTLTGQNFGFDRRAWLDWTKSTKELFAAGGVYKYPAFSREKTLLEYLPFVPLPPNEVSTTPVGMPPPGEGG